MENNNQVPTHSTAELSADDQAKLRAAIDTPMELDKPALTPEDIAKEETAKAEAAKLEAEAKAKGDNKPADEDDDELDVELTPEQKKEKEEAEAKAKAEADAKAKEGEDPANADPDDDGLSIDALDYSEIAKKNNLIFEGPITTQEEFSAAIENTIKQTKDVVRKELFDEVTELAGYSPEAQFHLRALNAGLSPEDLVNPGGAFDEMINLNDKALVMENIKATQEGISDENLQLEVDGMDDDEIKSAATKLRQTLTEEKGKFVSKHKATQQEFVQKRLAELKTKSEAFDKSVVDAIKNTKDVYGVSLKDALKDQAANKYIQNKEYRMRLTSDPAYIAKLILQAEHGERAVAKLVERSEKRAKNQEKKANHEKNYNLDDIAKDKKASIAPHVGKDGFESWGAIRDQSVTTA